MEAFIWTEILAASVTLFFIMDPLGNIPIFNALLKNFSRREKARIICRELIFALIILLVFLIAGTRILGFLGLTQPSLGIAGGILLFIIAMRMIYPPANAAEDRAEDDPFIVPLAMPLIAGPSTIAVLLLMSSAQPGRIYEWIIALILAWLLTTLILIASLHILKFLGSRGLRAMERLMGMLLILIAIQMFLDGLTEYLRANILTGI